MKIDDFLDRNKDFSCEGYYLRDAIVFKIDMVPLTMDEIGSALKPYYDFQEDAKSKVGKNIGTFKNPVVMEYGESGLTDYDMARFPYKNVVFIMDLGNNRGMFPFWFLFLYETDEMIKHSVITLDDRNSVLTGNSWIDLNICKFNTLLGSETEVLFNKYRTDFYQKKEDLSLDWGETFFKKIDGSNCLNWPNVKTEHLIATHAALKICAILSCSNIKTVDNPPPEKLNKKRAKNRKLPLFTYKTLNIKQSQVKKASQENQNIWDNRIHLCRGHFKTYTEENPLFGRLVGKYWWQPSVRPWE